MVQIRTLLIFSLTLLLLIACDNSNVYLSKMNNALKEQKAHYGKEFKKTNLLSHFPDDILSNGISLRISPPSCPPSYECRAQFGNVYLITKNEISNKFTEPESVFDVKYSEDSNIVINLSELRKDIFPVKKCNKWYQNKLPIPYFESCDFGLGQKVAKKYIDGDSVPYFEYTYTIPSDLYVYVVKAEPGDFWKESCNENRPIALKEWQHGYSKGFAVSEEQNIIVYWVMIW